MCIAPWALHWIKTRSHWPTIHQTVNIAKFIAHNKLAHGAIMASEWFIFSLSVVCLSRLVKSATYNCKECNIYIYIQRGIHESGKNGLQLWGKGIVLMLNCHCVNYIICLFCLYNANSKCMVIYYIVIWGFYSVCRC